MSQENVEVARRAVAFFVGLGGPIEADQAADRMSDSALQEFLDPEVELIPVAQGLLGGNTYKGYEGIRRFWGDFFSAWDEFHAEPKQFLDADPQVVVVLRMRGRMHELEVDEVWSQLMTFRNGRSFCSRPSRAQTVPSKPPGCRGRRCRGRTWRGFANRCTPLIGVTGLPGSRSVTGTWKSSRAATGRKLVRFAAARLRGTSVEHGGGLHLVEDLLPTLHVRETRQARQRSSATPARTMRPGEGGGRVPPTTSTCSLAALGWRDSSSSTP
jgi:hypothetical protein